MQDARVADDRLVDVLGRIRARARRDCRRRRTCGRRRRAATTAAMGRRRRIGEAQARQGDAGGSQRIGDEMAEPVVADRAHEARRDARSLATAGRNVGRRAAGRLDEGLGGGEPDAGDRRHQIDQSLAKADDVGHTQSTRAVLELPARIAGDVAACHELRRARLMRRLRRGCGRRAKSSNAAAGSPRRARRRRGRCARRGVFGGCRASGAAATAISAVRATSRPSASAPMSPSTISASRSRIAPIDRTGSASACAGVPRSSRRVRRGAPRPRRRAPLACLRRSQQQKGRWRSAPSEARASSVSNPPPASPPRSAAVEIGIRPRSPALPSGAAPGDAAQHHAAAERGADRHRNEIVDIAAVAAEQLGHRRRGAVVLGEQRGIEPRRQSRGEVEAAPGLVPAAAPVRCASWRDRTGVARADAGRGAQAGARRARAVRQTSATISSQATSGDGSGPVQAHGMERRAAEIDQHPDQRVAAEADTERPDAVGRKRQESGRLAAAADGAGRPP